MSPKGPFHQLARTAKPQPIPQHIAPMLATLSKIPAREQEYGVEFKWDGVRAICFWDGRTINLDSRNLLDITPRYPELAALGHTLKHTSAIFDGEIVALDEQARPSFSLLQRRMHVANVTPALREINIVYMIFDLLYFNNYSLMSAPYERRRELLENLNLSGPYWQTPPFRLGKASELLTAARNFGLEGVVAKKMDSLYIPGARSREWLKIKVIQRQATSFVDFANCEGWATHGISAAHTLSEPTHKSRLAAPKIADKFDYLTALQALADQLAHLFGLLDGGGFY